MFSRKKTHSIIRCQDEFDVKKMLGSVGGLAFLTLLATMKQSGFCDSIWEKWIIHNNRKRMLACSIPNGTPLLVALGIKGLALVEHSGIYVGNNEVVELYGSGVVKKVSLTDFLNGKGKEVGKFRFGRYIFAACDDASGKVTPTSETIANKALESVGRKFKYHICRNNCHRLTASFFDDSINMDKPISTKQLVMDGGYSIVKLTNAISNKLNGDKKVVWLQVESNPDFRYVSMNATEGKKEDQVVNV